jgi:hypothetical protein
MLVHANHPPTTKKIQGRLRRVSAYIAMAPASRGVTLDRRDPGITEKVKRKALHLEALGAHRRIQCALGSTTTHWATALSTDNVEFHKRAKSSTPLKIPPSCHKVDFTTKEQALLEGLDP